MTLNEFNSRFIYQLDKDKFGIEDVWEIIIPDEKGFFVGDCESYSLSLREYVENMSDNTLYWCKYDGINHVVSKTKNGYWIDNILLTPTKTLPNEYTNLRKLYEIEVYARMKFSKILLFFKRFLK